MAQRLLALDLDGTTLNHMGELSDRVRDAVRALPDDVAVVIATGRSIIATMPILEALGLREGYAVCSNGALTLRARSVCGRGLLDHRHGDLRPARRCSRRCGSRCPTRSSPSRSPASASR